MARSLATSLSCASATPAGPTTARQTNALRQTQGSSLPQAGTTLAEALLGGGLKLTSQKGGAHPHQFIRLMKPDSSGTKKTFPEVG